ncbi:MAG TPA: tetratricopeptide repeat protein [Gammaproteobacteria bacterium]
MAACSTMSGTGKTQQSTAPAATLVPQNYEHAISAIKTGKTKEAEKLFTDITETNPGFSNAHTNLGLLYLNNKQIDKAEDSLRKAISLNPEDSVAYNHLGIVLREKGKFTESKAMYLQAIKHNSEYAIAYLNLGILYDLYLQELNDALVQYKQYQSMTNNNDKLVDKWIIDLEHRIKSESKG